MSSASDFRFMGSFMLLVDISTHPKTSFNPEPGIFNASSPFSLTQGPLPSATSVPPFST